jgi:hypothetical protein
MAKSVTTMRQLNTSKLRNNAAVPTRFDAKSANGCLSSPNIEGVTLSNDKPRQFKPGSATRKAGGARGQSLTKR